MSRGSAFFDEVAGGTDPAMLREAGDLAATVLVRGAVERAAPEHRTPVAGPRAHILPAPRVPDDDVHWLRVTPHTVSGRRISARPGTEWSWGIGALM